MQSSECLLAHASACYRQWGLCLEQFQVRADSFEAAAAAELDRTYQAAVKADLALRSCLPNLQLESSAAFAEYRSLVFAAARQIESLKQVAQTLKALTAAELCELRGGQAAMSGYRTSGDQRGSLVRSAC